MLSALATGENTKTHQSLVQAAEALISFKKPAAGKSLFEKENKEEIVLLMKKKLDTLKAKGVDDHVNVDDASSEEKGKEKKHKENAGAEYQRALTELWEKADREEYKDRAKGNDVNE